MKNIRVQLRKSNLPSRSTNVATDAQQMSMGGQFLYLLGLLLRFKGYRCAFLLVTAALMFSNLWISLLSTRSSRTGIADDIKFYNLYDFASSSARVLIDRSAFPAEADAAATIVSAKGGSTSSWIADCSPETACRAQFIGQRDPSVVAYMRYAKKNIRRHILECFWVDNSEQMCAILYQLMVQSVFTKTRPQIEFEDLHIFELTDEGDTGSKNRTIPDSDDSMCNLWTHKKTYSSKLHFPFLLMKVGVTLYLLATTISFIGILKAGGFYQQLVRNGLSVTCYWTAIWLVGVIECMVFSALFVLSHYLPCPGVFAFGSLAMVFIMLSVLFIEMMAITLLLEILMSSLVAVCVLMMVISVALSIIFDLYHIIALKYPLLANTVPMIQVMEYIQVYMTSGAKYGERKTPEIEKVDLYHKMLSVNIISATLLILITIFFDFLLLSGNGLRLPAHFPFTGRFWCPAVSGKTDDSETPEPQNDNRKEVPFVEPHIEPVVGVTPSIVVDNVSKAYKCCPCMSSTGRPKVLQELSCQIYKNQITALIGHNGAGKSTLIKILTGDENPDSGSAHIGGIEVTNPIERLTLRGSISVCPQFDALCEALSVIECIKITLICKGVSGHSELERARSMLKRLGLGDKENVMPTDLSGGQKRKVSTIIALLGDPKVVFLDEPTSGLDPVSRRQLWQLLQEEKLDRSIVLCTQFMDEADILADRKIFLCGGKIVCAGSSMFLKRAFGCSFTITVSLKSEKDAQKLLSRLKEVQLKSQFKTELQLEIPASKPNVLIAAVEALEDASEIEAFGLSQANLDDVFMRLSGVSSTDVIEAFRSGNLAKLQDKPDNDVMNNLKEEFSKLSERSVEAKPSCITQFQAILCVNLRKQWRTSSTFLSRYVISALLLLLLVFFILLGKISSPPGKVIKNMSQPEMQNYLNNLDVNSGGFATKSLNKVNNLVRSDKFVIVPDIINVVCLHDDGSSNASLSQSCGSLTINGLDSASEMSKPQDEDLKSFLLRKSTKQELRKRCEGGLCKGMKGNKLGCEICILYYASTWNRSTENSRRKMFIGVFLLKQKSKFDTVHAYRGAMDKVWEYFGKADMNDTAALSHVRPFSSFFSAGVPMVIILIFSLFPVSYLNDPIDDITTRVLNQLLSMGMTFQSYWMNLFFLHWIQYCVCFSITVGILFISDKYRHWQYFVYAIIPVMIIGTASNQLLMYIVASVKRKKSALVLSLCNFTAVLLSILTVELSSKDHVILILIVLIPPVAPMALILYGLLPAQYTKEYYLADSIGNTPGAFDNYWAHSFVCWPIIMMPIHFVVLLCVLILSEFRQSLRIVLIDLCSSKRPISNADQVNQGGSADQGAQNEYNRLMQTAQNADNVLEVRQLSKIYPNGVQAVRGVTFGVMSGEIFGLLGANGAGKSTSMSVIVGEEAETSGSVQVRSQDGRWSSGQSGAAMELIGYCPQHNPLFDFITVAEHLALYASIRGLPANVAQFQVDALMQGLGLQQHKDKQSCELSGGNKRRLCLAIALLGDPMLIVVDEASTGVDPENKRFIWGAIRGMLKEQRAVMLTTHSMEEVEALCNRVAIMNRGRIIAFGTVQQLRSQYGDAYTMDALLAQDSAGSLKQRKANIKSAVAAQFKSAALLEDLGLCLQFAVPTKSVKSLSDALKWLDANKTKLGIVSHSFCQMSLDQVFVKLVNKYDSSSASASEL